MENMLDKALKVARSDTVKASGKTLFKDIIGILMYDPNAAWSMLEDVKKLSSTIRDGIFFECLETNAQLRKMDGGIPEPPGLDQIDPG